MAGNPPFPRFALCGSVIHPRGPLRNTVLIELAATLLAGCQSDSVVATPPVQSPDRSAKAEILAAANQPLWTELTPVNGVFIGTPAGAVTTPSNDFVVPARTVWNVSSIVLRGAQGTANPSPTLVLAFRANGVGQPATLIQRFTLTAVSRTPVGLTDLSDFRFDLAQPVTLGAGTYWLDSQCAVFLIECGLGPVVGQQAFITFDAGATWTAGFPEIAGPVDNLFALIGTAETPESRITDLQATVASLGLDGGTAKSLQFRLQLALADLGAGDVTGACGAMQDFITLVNGKASKKLTAAQAAALTASATGIRTLIGC
jgi:hypothetical protein